jgi:hypothetical protein
MYIRWQYRWRAGRPQFDPYWQDDGTPVQDVHWSAIIVESTRVNGKPKQRHVAYLAGFTESAIKIDAQRCFIWDSITDRLDRLGNRITPADRQKIEAAVAEKVPRPTPVEYKEIARRSAQIIGCAIVHQWSKIRRSGICLGMD